MGNDQSRGKGARTASALDFTAKDDERFITDPQFRPGPGKLPGQAAGVPASGMQSSQNLARQNDASGGAGKRHLDPQSPPQQQQQNSPPRAPAAGAGGGPREPSQFNLPRIEPRHFTSFPMGVRIVKECTDFDATTESLVKVFAPVEVPAGMCCGCTMLDRFTGHHAIVCGLVHLRDKKHVLYMHVDGHRGATPFVTDGAFLHRWQVLEKDSLPLKATFTLPGMTHLEKDLIYTGVVAPVPVDVSQLNKIGLETGMTISGKGKTYKILGLTPAPGSTEITLLCRSSTGDPHYARRGEVYTLVSHRHIKTLKGSISKYRSVDVHQQLKRDETPLTCDKLFSVDGLTVAAFDTDPDRCMAYYELKPGEVLNGNKVVVGIKYGPPKGSDDDDEESSSRRNKTPTVNLFAMKLDSETQVAEIVHAGATVMVTGFHTPPTSAAPLRPSLGRAIPTSERRHFLVPNVPQDLSKYKFNFVYTHASQRILRVDPVAMEEMMDLELGQRMFEEAGGRYMTAIGVGLDHVDGTVTLMVEVDGAAGVVAVSPGSEFYLYEDRVRVYPFKGKSLLYANAELREDVKITPTKFYPLGANAWVEGVDADPDRCLQMFGMTPGMRLSNSFTVIGMQKVEKEVVMFFHQDGAQGATCFDDGVVSFYVCDPVESIDVQWVTGRTLKYKPVAMNYAVPWHGTHGYRFVSELSTVEPVDADEERCKKYFGLTPGQRLGGRVTFLGLALRDDEVFIAGHKEGEKVARLFAEPVDLFIFEDIVPIQLQSEDPKKVKVVVYNPAPVDPRHPLRPDFPAYIGGGEKPKIGLLDVNKDRCARYFDMIPGVRVNSVATVAGMVMDPERNLVLLLFFIDGCKGAGGFDPGQRLELDGEIRPVVPLNLAVPIPTGSYTEVVLPPLPQYAEAYRFHFPAITPSGVKILLDNHFMAVNFGIHFGQRAKIGDEYCSVAGIGVGADGASYFFKKDEGSGCAIAPPGVVVRLYEMVVTIPPFLSKTVCYFDKPLSRELPPLVHSVPVKVQMGDSSEEVALDTDPRRCFLYFGIVPGQRADGKLICVGMASIGPVVKLFFRPENEDEGGAGTIPSNTDIELEQMNEHRLHQLEQEAAAFREQPAENVVKYQATAKAKTKNKEDAIHMRFKESDSFIHHTPVQADGMKQVGKLTKQSDSTASVLNKIRMLGHPNPQDALDQVLAFICSEAATCSWFKPFKLIGGKPSIELFTEDIAMRTLFEVGAGNACEQHKARKSWETRIFRGAYDNDPDYNRPKYGVINVWNDPHGPRCPGDQYGDCFLVFAGLRDMTSVTPCDSSDATCRIATLHKGLVNILDEFVEGSTEFENLVKVACGLVASATSVSTDYKEIQLHASVFFEQNISHVVINPHYLERPAELHLLLNFARKNGCWLITNKTTHALAAMRLWTVDQLKQFCVENDVRLPLTQMYATPKLIAGPQTEEARVLYDVICDYVCMSEMDEIRQIAELAVFSEWKPVVE